MTRPCLLLCMHIYCVTHAKQHGHVTSNNLIRTVTYHIKLSRTTARDRDRAKHHRHVTVRTVTCSVCIATCNLQVATQGRVLGSQVASNTSKCCPLVLHELPHNPYRKLQVEDACLLKKHAFSFGKKKTQPRNCYVTRDRVASQGSRSRSRN